MDEWLTLSVEEVVRILATSRALAYRASASRQGYAPRARYRYGLQNAQTANVLSERVSASAPPGIRTQNLRIKSGIGAVCDGSRASRNAR
jgi:hypothetical protein